MATKIFTSNTPSGIKILNVNGKIFTSSDEAPLIEFDMNPALWTLNDGDKILNQPCGNNRVLQTDPTYAPVYRATGPGGVPEVEFGPLSNVATWLNLYTSVTPRFIVLAIRTPFLDNNDAIAHMGDSFYFESNSGQYFASNNVLHIGHSSRKNRIFVNGIRTPFANVNRINNYKIIRLDITDNSIPTITEIGRMLSNNTTAGHIRAFVARFIISSTRFTEGHANKLEQQIMASIPNF